MYRDPGKLLEESGCFTVRSNDSRRVYQHAVKTDSVVVPVHRLRSNALHPRWQEFP